MGTSIYYPRCPNLKEIPLFLRTICDEEEPPITNHLPVLDSSLKWKQITAKITPDVRIVHDMATGAKHEWEMDFKQRLTECFQQMMYVSGETAEASPETTYLIEEVVREQVVEMVSSARSFGQI